MKKPGIVVAAFALCCAAMCAVTLFSYFDPHTESMTENRNLAKHPKVGESGWFSGDFASDYESFLSDHVFERENLISAAQTMESLIEREMEIKIVSSGNILGEDASKETSSESSKKKNTEKKDKEITDLNSAENKETPEELENTQSAETEKAGGEGADVSDNVVMLSDRILSTYYYSEKNVNRYIDTASRFFDMYPEYVTKVNVLVPSRIAFEEPKIASLCDDQRAAANEVYSGLDSLIYTVDMYPYFEEYKNDLDKITYRTDHHWTHFGSYLGAKAIYDELGLKIKDIDQYEERVCEPFLGYLYAQHQSDSIKNHKDELICYFAKDHDILTGENHKYDENGKIVVKTEPIIDPTRTGYYTFAARSFAWLTVKGADRNGPCILLVGDSYCNALTTWLAENASTLVVMDPRDYNEGRQGMLDLYEEYNFDTVILCDYMGVLESPYFIGRISAMTE